MRRHWRRRSWQVGRDVSCESIVVVLKGGGDSCIVIYLPPGTSFNGRTPRSQCGNEGSIPFVSSLFSEAAPIDGWAFVFLRDCD